MSQEEQGIPEGAIVSPYRTLWVLNDPKLHLDLSPGNSLIVKPESYFERQGSVFHWTDLAFANKRPINAEIIQKVKPLYGPLYTIPILSAPNDEQAVELVREHLPATPSNRFLIKLPKRAFLRLYEVRPAMPKSIVKSDYFIGQKGSLDEAMGCMLPQQREDFEGLLRIFHEGISI